jgi:hypothetical protein
MRKSILIVALSLYSSGMVNKMEPLFWGSVTEVVLHVFARDPLHPAGA